MRWVRATLVPEVSFYGIHQGAHRSRIASLCSAFVNGELVIEANSLWQMSSAGSPANGVG